MFFLAWRDIKVKYKQSILGASWAIIQPFMMMVVFTVFFGNIAKVGSDGLPYPLWSFAALLPWTLFANTLTQTSNSLVTNASMITKIYFPRLSIPFASVGAGLVDFCIAFVVLAAMMWFYRVAPTPRAGLLPIFVLLALVTSLGVGLWLSALNVRFRDVRQTLPFLAQLWLFATPVVYPSSRIAQPWRTVLAINPMVGVVEGFRWGLLRVNTAPGPLIAVSTGVALTLFVGGLFTFRRMERGFADVV